MARSPAYLPHFFFVCFKFVLDLPSASVFEKEPNFHNNTYDTFLNSYHQNEAKNKEAVKGGIERKLIGRGNSVLSSLLLVDPVHLFRSVDAQIEPVVYLTMYCIHG